jgi:hypothetical protein
MKIWKDAIVPNNEIDGLLCTPGGKVVLGFEKDMKLWSTFVSMAEDDHGASISDATIMTVVLALVAAVGWFAFGDAVGGFLGRM